MKLMFITHMLLIDCGKASKQTKGMWTGLFSEAGGPPTNRYNN
jgi:hypothetical protein